MKTTKELLEANGWSVAYYHNIPEPNLAYIYQDGCYAEFQFGRNTLRIWSDCKRHVEVDGYCDIYVRVCETTEKLAMAFLLADIDYKLKTE